MWLSRLGKEYTDLKRSVASQQKLAQEMTEKESGLEADGKCVILSVLAEPKRADRYIHLEGKERINWIKKQLVHHYDGGLRNVKTDGK